MDTSTVGSGLGMGETRWAPISRDMDEASMSDEIRQVLLRGGVIDITTTARRNGEVRRIEVRLHEIDGQLYLSGQPEKRNWYANLLAKLEFQVHLKRELVCRSRRLRHTRPRRYGTPPRILKDTRCRRQVRAGGGAQG